MKKLKTFKTVIEFPDHPTPVTHHTLAESEEEVWKVLNENNWNKEKPYKILEVTEIKEA